MAIATFTSARDALLALADAKLSNAEVCAEVARAIALVAPHHAGALMTTDPDTHLPAGGVVSGFDTSACVPFWDNELLDPDFNKFNDLTRSHEPVATLFEATDGELIRSPRFQKLYAEYGAVDELRFVLRVGTMCLAIGAFIRCEGEPFTPTEVSDVRHLLVPAANAVRNCLTQVEPHLPQGVPVVLLLDDRDEIVHRSAGADEVLADLRVEPVDSDLPGTVRIAAARVRNSRRAESITTRLRRRNGQWVRVHVSPMAEDGTLVSVTIDAARASDLVPILLGSYGLTERETAIVLAVCRGIGTKEIATELSISAHTVRDHLKSIFEKSGVNSRGELVATLFTSHVLDRFHETIDHV